ncbi:MAG: hypothetical protein ACRCSQ_01100 [Bacteroidales bacterium]
MKNFLFIICLILPACLIIPSCSDDDRLLLEKQQIPIAFHLSVCDTISPHLFFLQKSQESGNSDSLSEPYRMRADIEICLFNDPNKTRIYSVGIKSKSLNEWVTDSIRILNPGFGTHLVKQICVYPEKDNDSPLYTSITPTSICSSYCESETQMPKLLGMQQIDVQKALNVLPVTLFSTWQHKPEYFGYERWCKQQQSPSFAFSFQISDTTECVNYPGSKNLRTGYFILSKKTNDPFSSPSIIDERIIVQEIKTTIRLSLTENPDEQYILEFYFPNKDNPEIMISDTITASQLTAYRESGFWVSEKENPEDGSLRFDLSQTKQTKQGILCHTDSVFRDDSWTPVYSKK